MSCHKAIVLLSAIAGLLVWAATGFFASPVQAENEGTAREAIRRDALVACAAPNNLPFSNKEGEGFENRIAQLISDELKVPLTYRWYPQSVGFVRRTLNLRECDLILGMPAGNERVQNTNPYYYSTYAMVYRTDSGMTATTLADPDLRTKRIGVIAGTPPATLLALHDLLGRVEAYQRTVDTRHFHPAQDAIEDVAKGKLDVALIWGPIAGYFASRQSAKMTVIPLTHENPAVRMAFRIGMAVRYREPEWKRLINRTLAKLKPEIDEILRDFEIPLLDEKGQLIVAAAPSPELAGYAMDNYLSPVPATLAGATVVDAKQVKALIESTNVVLIDVLPSPPKPKTLKPGSLWMPVSREKIPGTHWLANVGYGRLSDALDHYFRSNLKRLTGANEDRPVLFYCRADCWMSWNAAKRAMEYGYRKVYWFPDGIDAWEKENFPTESQQPIEMEENESR